jgi:microcin C transport system permease protein
MGAYILRRLLLMIPTIVGIMAISFIVVQFAPGGPVEQVISQLTGQSDNASDRLSGGGDLLSQQSFDDSGSKYRGAQGLDPISSRASKSSSASTSRRRNVSR